MCHHFHSTHWVERYSTVVDKRRRYTKRCVPPNSAYTKKRKSRCVGRARVLKDTPHRPFYCFQWGWLFFCCCYCMKVSYRLTARCRRLLIYKFLFYSSPLFQDKEKRKKKSVPHKYFIFINRNHWWGTVLRCCFLYSIETRNFSGWDVGRLGGSEVGENNESNSK